jgi:hypothetical protein
LIWLLSNHSNTILQAIAIQEQLDDNMREWREKVSDEQHQLVTSHMARWQLPSSAFIHLIKKG